jgi:hypothetical protein
MNLADQATAPKTRPFYLTWLDWFVECGSGRPLDTMTKETSPTSPSRSSLERHQSTTVVQNAAAVTTDVTRRMICGGLAGMIAKVRQTDTN